MTILHDFEYFRPRGLDEALALLARHPGAAVLAGGTDLVPEMQAELRSPPALIDLKAIAELRRLDFHDGTLTVGALVTFTDLVESPAVREHFPLVRETALQVASVGIRNRATMAGNICSCVPCMDSGPLLRVYDAVVTVRGPDGERHVPAADWFVGPRRPALGAGEVLTTIAIPLPAARHGGAFVKLGRYQGEDLAQASVAVVALPGDRYRIAFGSVAPVPVRAAAIERLLDGRALDDAVLGEAAARVADAIAPITDIRASREYRLHMCAIMLERALRAAAARLAGGGPAYGTVLI